MSVVQMSEDEIALHKIIHRLRAENTKLLSRYEIDMDRMEGAFKGKCSEVAKLKAAAEDHTLHLHAIDTENKKLIASVAKLSKENSNLKRIIAQELTENDELGAEFVYVQALRDQLSELAAYTSELRSALTSIAALHMEPFCPELFDSPLDVLIEDTRIAREALAALKVKS